MNEFSPTIVGELDVLLRLVDAHKGDQKAISTAIVGACPLIKKTRPVAMGLKRARNVQIGMSECGLFDLKANALTERGASIAALPSAAEQYREFAKFLLKERHGSTLLDSVRSLQQRKEKVSLDAIRSELRERRFLVTTNEGNASKVRMWLEKSGIIDDEWNIDDERLEAVIGISNASRVEWRRLTPAQQALLLTLKNASPRGEWVSGSSVKNLCLTEWGHSLFPEGGFRSKVINPLKDARWLDARGERSHGGGRGGNIGQLRATTKLLEITAELGIDQSPRGIPQEVLDSLDRGLEELLSDLASSDTYRKGLALEVIAVRLAKKVQLEPVAFRLRGAATGESEVDLIAEGIHLHHSRWLIQCKNTSAPVRTEAIAREVGMAVLLQAHVVMVISTSGFTDDAGDYASTIEAHTPLQIVLIGGKVLQEVLQKEAPELTRVLRGQALQAQLNKAPQLSPKPPEIDRRD